MAFGRKVKTVAKRVGRKIKENPLTAVGAVLGGPLAAIGGAKLGGMLGVGGRKRKVSGGPEDYRSQAAQTMSRNVRRQAGGGQIQYTEEERV